MTLYEAAKNALEWNRKRIEQHAIKADVYPEPFKEFAAMAGINMQNNAFGILLALTSAKLIVKAVEQLENKQ